jgi:hypothetical protein
VTVAAKFFKRLLGFFVGPWVAGPYRQLAVAELGQNLPDRTLVERDTEAPLQFVAQIDPPPTHDPVHRGVGAGLDKLGQLGLLPRREF